MNKLHNTNLVAEKKYNFISSNFLSCFFFCFTGFVVAVVKFVDSLLVVGEGFNFGSTLVCSDYE
jgi:hypothetical protein